MNPSSSAAPSPKVGDILSSDWGYEQTRYTFYQVVGVTAKSVKLRKIAKVYVTRSGGGYATVMPVPGNFVDDDKPMTKRVGPSYRGTGYSVKITDYASASLWDGEPESESGDY